MGDDEFEFGSAKPMLPADQIASLISNAFSTCDRAHPERLLLFHCYLTALPPIPRHIIPRVVELDVRRNYMTSLDLSSAGAESDATESQSASVPVAPQFTFEWTKLAKLSLGANDLTEMPVLSAAPNLRELVMNHNRLKAITNLEHVPNLELLDLRSNKLEVVSGLLAVPRLQRLCLSCNHIARIDYESVPPLCDLQFFSLFGNYIPTLAEILPLLRPMAKLQKLLIGGNPFLTSAAEVPPPEIAREVLEIVPTLQWLNWAHVPSYFAALNAQSTFIHTESTAMATN
ncbi:hypothetical protein CAOG_03327 [Capsaspora owczarzaki ATCC 30864]|uniref:Uncharacterized protein n=1 Tax=Capsaspora owczarzaki (strain ATCC 30864) TaxID=595528 RepID=A0A0D2UBB6_CAPO3|nr:hypothetical protein CAOG_03327 [Capsaspora owczarzaki ATCC 30864]KJE92341.1 hypothetical protein CAOG_003327 [Capsaspora owczarzaki ATCC 30864]|eukprot:XP_004364166.2 hypothetical protein CAOG_03327 [Capsaspora owczarzaki ATCC 30864]